MITDGVVKQVSRLWAMRHDAHCCDCSVWSDRSAFPAYLMWR